MKRCPTCQSLFDDSNDYCLNDGTPLTVTTGGEIPTVIVTPGSLRPLAQPPSATGNRQTFLFVVILVLAMAAAGFGVAYFMSGNQTSTRDSGINSGRTSSSPNVNQERELAAEKDSLRRERELLEKERSAMNAASRQTNRTPQAGSRIVTVNSPRDKYLALKDRPCTAPCGGTLAKVPHGTTIMLSDCRDAVEVADGRNGRWCFTSYAGLSGWVFDGFVR